jgi:protein pelota
VQATADLAAVVMEMGLAHVCLVTHTMTLVKQKVELSVPRKRAGSTQHEKQRDKFFDYIIAALLQHIDWSVVKVRWKTSEDYVRVLCVALAMSVRC